MHLLLPLTVRLRCIALAALICLAVCLVHEHRGRHWWNPGKPRRLAAGERGQLHGGGGRYGDAA